MYPSKTTKNGDFKAVVPSYGQLEQTVISLRDEAAFYKRELEDSLNRLEKLQKELKREC